MKKKIIGIFLIIILVGVGKYVYDVNINYNFKEITKDNFVNREMHHHVFNKELIFQTLKFCKFEILNYLEKKEDLIILCKK